MVLTRNATAGGREWLQRFADRRQALLDEVGTLPAPSWLSLQRLLQDSPPTLTTPHSLILQAVLTRVVMRLARTAMIPAPDVVQMIDAVTSAGDSPEFFNTLERLFQRSRINVSEGEFAHHGEKRIARALEFIVQRQHNSNLALATVAAEVKLSPWYFARLLRRETGHTFEFYLHWIQVRQTQILLHERTLSVKEIAYMVGYRSTTQLDRLFRQIYGTSPKAYRRLLSNT
jgi:AraC-like DNA-binding protein